MSLVPRRWTVEHRAEGVAWDANWRHSIVAPHAVVEPSNELDHIGNKSWLKHLQPDKTYVHWQSLSVKASGGSFLKS